MNSVVLWMFFDVFLISAAFAQQELTKLVRVPPLAEQALAAPELWQLVAKELKQI